jgi:hypothetical protein
MFNVVNGYRLALELTNAALKPIFNKLAIPLLSL